RGGGPHRLLARHANRHQCGGRRPGHDFRRRHRHHRYYRLRRCVCRDLQRFENLDMSASGNQIKIEIRDLTMAFGSFVVMRDICATIKQAEIFVIMGGSGCGKSTLLRHMIGLKMPAKGDILYDGESFWQASDEARLAKLRTFGVLYQGGALWS